MGVVRLANGQIVDDDLSFNTGYKMAGSPIRCRVHGHHCRTVFHYPTEGDRRTYYACLACIEEHFGVEFVRHSGVIKW